MRPSSSKIAMGVVEVIAWPETYRRCESSIHCDEPVFVNGTLEVSEERCQIIADEVIPAGGRAREVGDASALRPARRAVPARTRSQPAPDARARTAARCRAFLHLLLPNRTETVIALPRGVESRADGNAWSKRLNDYSGTE